jgi:prevent-host-death family protein
MYIHGMAKRYSIAEARKNLPSLVDAAQSGSDVELTRRGKPLAVVISVEKYARLSSRRESFVDAYAKFRSEFPEGRVGIHVRFLHSLRDRSRGRKVAL